MSFAVKELQEYIRIGWRKQERRENCYASSATLGNGTRMWLVIPWRLLIRLPCFGPFVLTNEKTTFNSCHLVNVGIDRKLLRLELTAWYS